MSRRAIPSPCTARTLLVRPTSRTESYPNWSACHVPFLGRTHVGHTLAPPRGHPSRLARLVHQGQLYATPRRVLDHCSAPTWTVAHRTLPITDHYTQRPTTWPPTRGATHTGGRPRRCTIVFIPSLLTWLSLVPHVQFVFLLLLSPLFSLFTQLTFLFSLFIFVFRLLLYVMVCPSHRPYPSYSPSPGRSTPSLKHAPGNALPSLWGCTKGPRRMPPIALCSAPTMAQARRWPRSMAYLGCFGVFASGRSHWSHFAKDIRTEVVTPFEGLIGKRGVQYGGNERGGVSCTLYRPPVRTSWV